MAHTRLNVRFALLPAGLVLHCVAPSVVETLFDTASELSQLLSAKGLHVPVPFAACRAPGRHHPELNETSELELSLIYGHSGSVISL